MRRRTQAFKHHTGFVILENVPIGVCDTCGAGLPRESATAGRGNLAKKRLPERMESVPVAAFA